MVARHTISVFMAFTMWTGHSCPQGQLRFFNHHPDSKVKLIVVIPAYQSGFASGNTAYSGPCFLLAGKHPYIADSHTKNPSGDIYIFEHSQFHQDPNTARQICNNNYLNVNPKFKTNIFITRSDENREFHYGKPLIKNEYYDQKLKTGQAIEIPIAGLVPSKP